MTPEQQDLFTRIEAHIGRASPSTVAEWRHCAVRFGPESGSAKGALMQAVREISRCCMDVEEFYTNTGTHQFLVRLTSGDDQCVEFVRGSMVQALTATLEAAS